MRVAALLLPLAFAAAACSDTPTGPKATDDAAARIASVEYTGTRAGLYLDAGQGRTRVSFTGATDAIPGNSPLVPPLLDANLLALGPVVWSPDGERLAMVATLANDQSEVVVTRKDGSDPRVASVNTQYIIGGLDWSPDGTRLAYGMATLPQARGIDLFITTLATSQVQRVTQGASYGATGSAVRFSADGASLLYARKLREGGAPLFQAYSQIRRITLATGADVAVSGEIAGEVQAIARDGTWAVVLRRTAVLADGDFDRALMRTWPNSAIAEQVLVASGKLDGARLTPDESRLVFVRSEGSSSSPTLAHLVVPIGGGAATALRGTTGETIVADAWFPR